jgi:hypothetical protein
MTFEPNSLQWRLIGFAGGRSRLALEVCEEGLVALSRALVPPPLKMIPAPIVRACLENAATTIWLLDPSIAADVRLQRAVGLQKQDLDEGRRLTQLADDVAPEHRDLFVKLGKQADEQRSQFLEDASKLGLRAISVPADTSLVGEFLDMEYDYRVMSGLAHGSRDALRAISAMYSGPTAQPGVPFFFFIHTAADSYCRAVWALVAYLADEDQQAALRAQLIEVYDSLGFAEEPRAYFMV